MPRSPGRRTFPPTTTTGRARPVPQCRAPAQADKQPEKLSEIIDLMIRNGTNWNPTMSVYEDNRDWWRARAAGEGDARPSQLIAAGPNTSDPRVIQDGVEDVGRDQLEAQLRDLDEVGEEVPRAGRSSHRRQRRGGIGGIADDPRARSSCRKRASIRSTSFGRDDQRDQALGMRSTAVCASAVRPTSRW